MATYNSRKKKDFYFPIYILVHTKMFLIKNYLLICVLKELIVLEVSKTEN